MFVMFNYILKKGSIMCVYILIRRNYDSSITKKLYNSGGGG